MEKTYRYRGFDIVVNTLRLEGRGAASGCLNAPRAYMAGITLRTQLLGGEWSTVFRVGPVSAPLSPDLREVLAAGFAAGRQVVDDVVGVMGDALARHGSAAAPEKDGGANNPQRQQGRACAGARQA